MGRSFQPARRIAELIPTGTGEASPAARPGGSGGASVPARVAAHRILEDVEQGAYADRAAERRLAGLPARERRLATQLAYGCVRLRARLDTELARLASRPLSQLDRSVHLWLRLGLYQLREMRVPDHAAVHETVAGLRRTAGDRASGFVNGVLRSAARLPDPERAAFFPTLAADPIGHLTTYGSHPEWLVRRWLERWPVDTVARLVELDNRAPPVTLRALGRAAGERAAGEPGLAPVSAFPDSWILRQGDPTGLLDRLPAVVQDPAASAVVDYLGPLDRGPVLDICAAPGGKAVAIASGRTAEPYVAADVSHPRISRAARAGERRDVDLLAVVADGRRPPFRSARTVLLDAPCLGTGVLRRRVDARWRARPDRLAALVKLQGQLLDAAAGLIEPGGLLVYATCSLEPEENEGQVSAFLERQPKFTLERPPSGLRLPRDVIGSGGELQLLPWQRETDGAFAARMRRSA